MIKRGIDIAVSLTWLIALSLPLALIAVAIKAKDVSAGAIGVWGLRARVPDGR